MKRLCVLVILGGLSTAGTAQDKFATVAVTGTIQLPAGASYPAKVRIDVEIAKIEPGEVITFHKVVGSTRMEVIKSTPVEFKVSCPQSHLKTTPANMFTLRAKVYDLGGAGGRSKLLYETPMNEALRPFTEDKQPKQNVTLPVKAPVAK